MPSLKILIPAIFSLAATTAAAASCPRNWLENTFKGDAKCCYGNMLVEDRDAYCCIYDVDSDMELLTATSSIATTSTTDDNWSSAGECFTKVPFTASDYSSLVSSASHDIAATKTGPSTNEATATATGSSSASASASGSASASDSSSSNAAMPVATAQGVVLGGVAIAAAFFV